ncbi:hypothetical protein CVT26_007647, partial [Gymnopilus dilepis]
VTSPQCLLLTTTAPRRLRPVLVVDVGTSTTVAEMMLLVELPAIDTVPVPALPSFDLGLFHALTRPSTWLVFLATLVILSSIRAALLYIRPPTWTKGRQSVSYVQIVKEEKVSTTVVEAPSSASASVQVESKVEAAASSSEAPAGPSEGKKMTSWFWGLVKWDSLPSAPSIPRRGMWVPPPPPSPPPQMQQIRRPGPAFDHPLPALYDSREPISMAKMIMSRHTFRRPASRPPPVRNTSVPQYQRRTPSMV